MRRASLPRTATPGERCGVSTRPTLLACPQDPARCQTLLQPGQVPAPSPGRPCSLSFLPPSQAPGPATQAPPFWATCSSCSPAHGLVTWVPVYRPSVSLHPHSGHTGSCDPPLCEPLVERFLMASWAPQPRAASRRCAHLDILNTLSLHLFCEMMSRRKRAWGLPAPTGTNLSCPLPQPVTTVTPHPSGGLGVNTKSQRVCVPPEGG